MYQEKKRGKHKVAYKHLMKTDTTSKGTKSKGEPKFYFKFWNYMKNIVDI